MKKRVALVYFRTSSAANIGPDKDSQRRQREAVTAYAKAQRLEIAKEFYDAAVSGADPVDTRPGFVALLDRCKADGISIVLVENASRFARDLTVQLTGHALLQRLGIELIPVDAPTYFTDPSPTAVMVAQILGAVSQFQKANLVITMRQARDQKWKNNGRCEGRKAIPDEVVALAKKLHRASPKTGKRRSLRVIAAVLAANGYTVIDKQGEKTTRPYAPCSVERMLNPKTPTRARLGTLNHAA